MTIAKNIVIVGDGIAAVTAVKAIREHDGESDIYLFGEEKFYPYNRIRLSKGIFDELEENKVLLQKKEWYEQNRVKIFVETKVTSIDTNSKEVHLHNGDRITYDKLLFANGVTNIKPPIDGIDKSGVYTLRTLKDALSIKEKLNEVQQIVIIGGGIQGLEMAWIFQQHGKKVIIIELIERLMPRQLDDRASKILRNIIEDCGIQVLTGKSVKKVLGSDKVTGVLIEGEQELKCDMVIYSTGTRPNIDLIKDTEIKANRGILINDRMETNIKDIYAAGDIAEYSNQVIGLWNIAIAQGKAAGYNIAGKDTVYENVIPVTTLNAFNISLFSMGCTDEAQTSKVLTDEQSGINGYKKIFVKDNRIIGAIVIGDTKKSPILKSAIESKMPLEEIDLTNSSAEELLNKLKR